MSRYDHEKKHGYSERGSNSNRSGYHWHNYWDEWHDVSRHHHHGEGFQDGQASSDVEDWRQFFYQFFGVWPENHWIFGGRRFGPWQQGMDSFNPFVATLLSKGGGLLPLYVLHLVSQQPRYGNEIMDILAERTNGQWVSNPGAIYPLLTELEVGGFIRGEWADPAKRTVRTYTITDSGQLELNRIKEIVGPKLEETIQVLGVLMQDLQNQPQSSVGTPQAAGDSGTPLNTDK